MEDTIVNNRIQHLCQTSAKELYNFAFRIYGNNLDDLQASTTAFVKAFVRISTTNRAQDTEHFKTLGLRYLYKDGKKSGLNTGKKRSLVYRDIELYHKLDQLDYNERFIILLHCFHKLSITRISQTLRLPKFLVFLASINPNSAELNFPSTPFPLLGFHG
jgi:hypothetical protein